ncbi:hypothetical protein [Paraburkholderia kururiensis]|uniref:Uncharacterized protein n=1 Tax=Paraburkholderia kururiensis TaxID=984307 RepID=A0ABZ0WTD2_9BURK|nr:hypothetical protein [Paraburkholderia kururiensis]WQD80508.1 hypothetical protein U0042_12960 [Paraburkholderia kururiensis]
MSSLLSEREALYQRIERACMCLFDTWCETRSVAPLTYLLHCWPLADGSARAIRRMRDTLRELQGSHPDSLAPSAAATLATLICYLDEALVEGSVAEQKAGR